MLAAVRRRAPVGVSDAQRVRVFEGGAAVHEAHVVARHHVVHHVDFALDDARDVGDQLRHAGAPALAVSVLGRRAWGASRRGGPLRGTSSRDGARVDAHAADSPLAFDDGDAFAQLGGLDGGALSGGTAADADEIELRVAHGPLHLWSRTSAVAEPWHQWRRRSVLLGGRASILQIPGIGNVTGGHQSVRGLTPPGMPGEDRFNEGSRHGACRS